MTGDGVNRGFRLRWTAIRRDLTDLVPVMGATVTVLLPEPVAPTRLTADGDANGVAALGSAPRRLYAWRIPLLPTWGEFELDLGWPSARAVAATAPAWQLEEERRNEARANLWRFIVVLGIVVVPAGVVGLPFVWWRFGRDPAVELPEGRVTEPPDDLTPGLVGALLHRRVPRHVHVATLIELCRRDVIAVWESGKDQWVLELRQPDAPLSPYEARLVHAAFPDGRPGETTDLFEAGWLLGRASDGLERQILEDLTEQGYFPSSPRSVRLAWGLAGLAVMIAGGIPAVALVDHTGTPAWVLLAGSQLLGWGLAAMGFLVPRRSARGAAARARWEAYATEIRWENPRPGEGATSRFDRELPFAIAFGCGASFVDRFAQVDTATPAWYVALGSLLDAPDEALRSADGHLMAGPITGAPLAYTADGLCRFLAKADDLFIRRTRI